MNYVNKNGVWHEKAANIFGLQHYYSQYCVNTYTCILSSKSQVLYGVLGFVWAYVIYKTRDLHRIFNILKQASHGWILHVLKS